MTHVDEHKEPGRATEGVVCPPGGGKTIRFSPGSQLEYKVLGEETNGAYALLEGTVPPGNSRIEPHVHHNEEEAFYVLEGEALLQLGTRSVRATAGTFVLIPRGVVHSHRNVGTGPLRWLMLFSPPQMAHYFEERTVLVQSLPTPTGPVDYAGLDKQRHAALARKYHMEFVEDPSAQEEASPEVGT